MSGVLLGLSLLILCFAARVWWLMETLAGWLQQTETHQPPPPVPMTERERSADVLRHMEQVMGDR